MRSKKKDICSEYIVSEENYFKNPSKDHVFHEYDMYDIFGDSFWLDDFDWFGDDYYMSSEYNDIPVQTDEEHAQYEHGEAWADLMWNDN